MICCDTCPFTPTCEEEDAFTREIFGFDDDEGQDDKPERCRYCGFLVVAGADGVKCKSGVGCPYHGQRVQYVAPPPPRWPA